jgi:predicted TIM-barrel fold metal-dependent hydrolase
MAHCGTFGGTDGFDAAVAACEEHPGVYLETTAALLTVGPDRWGKALSRLGPERVTYGSDYPFTSLSRIEEELALLEELDLDAAGKARVLGGNLRGLWEAAS